MSEIDIFLEKINPRMECIVHFSICVNLYLFDQFETDILQVRTIIYTWNCSAGGAGVPDCNRSHEYVNTVEYI